MNLRKQVGPAVWLLVLLGRFAPEGWDGVTHTVTADGNAITDAELAERLDAKPNTIAAWCRRLKKLGVLDWSEHSGIGRVFYLKKLHRVLGVETPPAPPAAPPQASLPEEPKKRASDARSWVN